MLETDNDTMSVKDIKNLYKNNKHNFIDLVDKQYAETTYTNLFKYIFQSDIELFKNFANEVLCISNITGKVNIEREEAHIDLLITDDNNAIVIENKIKSGINGIKYDIYGEEIGCQLLDYYNYVNGLKKISGKDGIKWVEDEQIIKKFKNKKSAFYIFTPDYNYIDTAKIKYIPETYKVVTYSKIYEFFNRYKNAYESKVPYYNEFLYAIEKHINNVDNLLEIETHKKFLNKIELS